MSMSERRRGGAGDFETASIEAGGTARKLPLGGALSRRLGFLAACACAAGAVLLLAGRGGAQSIDPGLVQLLKGMAIIKTAILLGAGAAIWWRLGSPIGPGLAAGYILTSAIAVSGAALVWTLTGLALAPFLFDGGLLAFLILALRDDNGPWLRVLMRRRARRLDRDA
jgi:hypothetical protein